MGYTICSKKCCLLQVLYTHYILKFYTLFPVIKKTIDITTPIFIDHNCLNYKPNLYYFCMFSSLLQVLLTPRHTISRIQHTFLSKNMPGLIYFVNGLTEIWNLIESLYLRFDEAFGFTIISSLFSFRVIIVAKSPMGKHYYIYVACIWVSVVHWVVIYHAGSTFVHRF